MDNKPCPFCGNTDLIVSAHTHLYPKFFHEAHVYCTRCDTEGPQSHEFTKEDKEGREAAIHKAFELWNQRD